MASFDYRGMNFYKEQWNKSYHKAFSFSMYFVRMPVPVILNRFIDLKSTAFRAKCLQREVR